jgi:hypothetical protein
MLQRGRVMGHILEFKEHTPKSCGKASRVSLAGSAEIVIFPGVRYERWGEEAKSDQRVATKRDRIELPD